MLGKAFRSKTFLQRVSSSYIQVYYCLFGDSSAPDDANFKCFQAQWPKINLSKDYHILEMSSEWLKEKSKLVICELQQIVEKEKMTKKAFVRGDYRQCVENTLALLGSAASNFFITNLALLPAPDGWANCYTAKKCSCGPIKYLMTVSL